MNLFKCACVAFCAILLCGCLESKGEFEAINAGKISAVYKNGTLKILDSHPTPSLRESAPLRHTNAPLRHTERDKREVSKPRESKPQNESMTNKRIDKLDSPLRQDDSSNFASSDLDSSLVSLAQNDELDSPSLAEGARGWVESAKNQPFILFFFTTTCGVCKAQIPILQEIAQELADENIKIYGILGNAPNKDLAQKYTESNAISLPIFYENAARRFFSQIVGGVKGVPVIVIFKDGKIDKRFIGLTPKSVLKRAII